MALGELTLLHYGGHEKVVPVIGFDSAVLFIQWEGVWNLGIRTNRIVGMPSWKAKDHEAVKKIHRMLVKDRGERIGK